MGTSEGRKAVRVQVEKQMFGKERFAGPPLMVGHRTLIPGPSRALPAPPTPGPCGPVVPGRSCPERAPSEFFQAVVGSTRVLFCVFRESFVS